MPLRREPKLFESLLRDEWLTPEARGRVAVWSLTAVAPDRRSICAQVAAAAWEGYLHDAVVRESAGVSSSNCSRPHGDILT